MKKFTNKKVQKNDKMKIIIIIILCCLAYEELNSFLNITISPHDEIENIENYLKLCNDSHELHIHFSENKILPKISIISPIFNRGEYLLRFLKSIQNQNFNDVEIILIDDFSTDNTVDLIKKYQTFDNRIILIKNKKNFGTFKSRNLGILKSKGEYSLLPDPDDILSQDSLKIFYTFATKYDYEMLRFNLYIGGNKIFFPDCANPTPSIPVFPPKIKTFLFYATGILRQIDFNVSNKFIKREALIRALNTLSKEYLNMFMINFEDGVLNYLLYRNIMSFNGFNSDTIKFIFIHLKLVFLYSKNTFYEKNMFNVLFRRLLIRKININRIKLMKGNVKFFNEAINMFLENEFVSINNKKYLYFLKRRLTQIH